MSKKVFFSCLECVNEYSFEGTVGSVRNGDADDVNGFQFMAMMVE